MRPSPAEAEIASLRSENGELRALLVAGNERIAELTAQVGRLADLVARSNERIAELAAAAGRTKRKGSAPSSAPSTVVPPPGLDPTQRAAFENRPMPPELPAREKPAPKPRRPTGRAPIPPHLLTEESIARPCTCGGCGGKGLDVVDTFDEENSRWSRSTSAGDFPIA